MTDKENESKAYLREVVPGDGTMPPSQSALHHIEDAQTPPTVEFSPGALEWLGMTERWTQPDMVMTIRWSAENAAGLTFGWDILSEVRESRIVRYQNFRVFFDFPPTDASKVRIKLAPAGQSKGDFMFDGPNPFTS